MLLSGTNVLAVDADDINRVSVRLTALVKGGGGGVSRPESQQTFAESPLTNHHLDA